MLQANYENGKKFYQFLAPESNYLNSQNLQFKNIEKVEKFIAYDSNQQLDTWIYFRGVSAIVLSVTA